MGRIKRLKNKNSPNKKHFILVFLSVFIFYGLFFSWNIPKSFAANDTKSIIFKPDSCTGWNQPDKAVQTDLLGSAQTVDFNENNSAYFQAGVPDLNLEASVADSPDLICAQFDAKEDNLDDYKILGSQIHISAGADTYEANEDVLAFYYSYDGTQWEAMDSFSLVSDVSNGTHEGWTYDLGAAWDKNKADNLQIKFTYFADDAREEISTAYVDGVYLKLIVEDLAPPLTLSDDTVTVEKSDYQTDEMPAVDINVVENSMFSFLGMDNDEREIKSITLVDPQGGSKDLLIPEETKSTMKHEIKELEISPGDFTVPGEYEVVVTMEQDGAEAEATEKFSWGVLVMNPTKSQYRMGETVNVGMGVLNSAGHTLCKADLVLEVVAPTGDKQTFKTADGSIINSVECGADYGDNVTNLPDYSASFVIEHNGNYQLNLTANTYAGAHTISEELVVSDVIAFDISRLTAMRIWPLADYEVFLEVVPEADYVGYFTEKVPTDFILKRVDQEGQEGVEGSTKTITWQVDWQAGQAYTLSYQYDAPDISPEIFTLGPATAEGFTEPRSWQIASDAVAPNGNIYYGDLDAVADKLRTQIYTDSSNTFVGEVDTTLPASPPGDVNWIAAKQSPVRNEQIAAFEEDGATADLYVLNCTGDCDAGGDYSTQWSNAGVGPVLSCDTTAGACTRPFDVGYEQLSGDAMVVYGDNASAVSGTTSKVYYCIWNGTNWNAGAGCAPADGTNSLPAITNYTGIPYWIRVIPMGQQFSANRSDKILVLAATDSGDLGAWIWNGSNWTTLPTNLIRDNISGGTPAMYQTQGFDGAWETVSGDAVVLFGDSATEDTTPASYKVYTTGSPGSWGAASAIAAVPGTCNGTATTTYITRWIELEASPMPTSDRMIAALKGTDTAAVTTTPAFFPYYWDGGAFVASGTTACDESTKATSSHDVDVAFEKYNNGTEFGFAITGESTTAVTERYSTFTGPATWGAIGTAFNTNDDTVSAYLFPSPNAGSAGADRIHFVGADIDCTDNQARWSGTAWSAVLPTTGTGIPPDCNNYTTAPQTEAPGIYYVNKVYAAWQKNWRWYRGTDLASTPTLALADEITEPDVSDVDNALYRLRVNVAELTNGAAETDARKKLKFVSAATCADPNTCPDASWTNVGDPGDATAWEYASDAESACTPTHCDDNNQLADTVLTSTSACSNPTTGLGCGTWVQDKDAAAGANMDHNASQVQEIEYMIQNISAAASTVYYFRLFDIEDNTAIFRQQNASVCGSGGASACTYPSLDTSTRYITVSGTSDISSLPGSTIQAAVNGAVVPGCSTAVSGTWSLTCVPEPTLNQIVTVFIDNAADGDESTAVTKYSAYGNATDMVLNRNTASVGSAGSDALTVGNLADWDCDNDEDVMYDADSSILDLEGCGNVYSNELISVLSTDSLTIAGGETFDVHNVNIAGSLISSAGGTFTVSGSWTNTGTFTASSETVNFTSTTTETINSTGASSASFNNVSFTGALGQWTLDSTLTATGDLTSTAGTLAGAQNLIVQGGDIKCNGTCGTITLTNGTTTLSGTGNFGTVALDPAWTFNNLTFSGATTSQGGGSATVTSVLTISASQSLNAGSKTWTLSGITNPFVIGASATFTPASSTFIYTGAGATNIKQTSYNNLEVKPGANGATHTFESGAYAIAGNFTAGNGTNTGVIVDAATNTPSVNVDGNFTISAESTFTYTSSGTLYVGGNWSNAGTNGIFTHNNSIVVFDAGATSKTIQAGGTGAGKTFYQVDFNNNSGGWTIQNSDMKVTSDLDITLVNDFTLASGRTLEIDGTFTLTATEAAATVWTGSILYLNSGTSYEVGGSTQGAVTYGTLQVGASTKIRLWQSTAASFSVNATGSVYSQDHANVDGQLYIYGNYSVPTTDYWSYATDFDSTPLGGSSRTVSVFIDPDYGVTVPNGKTLNIIGDGTHHTAVTRIGGSGGYVIEVGDPNGGTISINYADFDYMEGPAGLDLNSSTATVSNLDNCSFDNMVDSVATDAYIRLPFALIGASTTNFSTVEFSNALGGANFNINGTGDNTLGGYWRFANETGVLAGEDHDADDGVDESDPGMLQWTDSTFGFNVQGTVYLVDQVTPATSGAGGPCDGTTVLALMVDGVGPVTTSCDGVNAEYTFSGVSATAGQSIAIYLTSAIKGNRVYASDGDADTGIKLFVDTVIFADDVDGTYNIVDLDTYDDTSNPGDMLFDATAASPNTLSVNSNKRLYLWDGDIFDPNGTVTTTDSSGDVYVGQNATFYIDDASSAIAGDINLIGGGTNTTLSIGTNLSISGGALTTSSTNTTVAYTGTPTVTISGTGAIGGGTAPSITFFTLILSGTPTFSSNFTVADDLTLPASITAGSSTVTMTGTGTLTSNGATLYNFEVGAGTVNAADAMDVNGNLLISGGTFQAPSSLNLAGDFTNNSAFTANSGAVTLDGSSQQTVAGTLTGGSAFYDLTIINYSGADPDVSPSVIFSASAAVTHNFTATTASTKLRFLQSGTYTFQNIALNGQSIGSRVALRSSIGGTHYHLNVAGTRSVQYADAKDSDACGQAPDIDATHVSNKDSTGNTCWDFDATQFSISDTTIGFGDLTTANARYATGTDGSDAKVSAHTLTVRTSAANGYAVTYNGATLTGPGGTITAATITGDDDGDPTESQFALGITTNGDCNIEAGYDATSPADYNFVPGTLTTLFSEDAATVEEEISVYYLGNIAPITLPGIYTTDVVYIMTANF